MFYSLYELKIFCWHLDPNDKDLNTEDYVYEFLHGGVMEMPFRR